MNPFIASESGGVSSSMSPAAGATVANWNGGVATSGLAGGDLVVIGANNEKHVLYSALVGIALLTAGAIITIRMYMQVNGTERLFYSQDFVQGTDPDSLAIINGSIGIHEALRLELYSNNALDDGLSVAYDYLME